MLSNNLYLPRPYEDELLYSIFARYHSYLQPVARKHFRKEIMGSEHISVLYGTDIDTLARRTFATWSMSAFDILRLHTVYPYYAFFRFNPLPDAFNSFLNNRAHALDKGVPMPSHLRYCRSCVRRDLSTLGETYWRRMHQLSGVLLCTEHEELLASSHAPSSPSTLEDLHDATAASGLEPPESAALTERERHLALDIARRCQGLFTSAPSKWVHLFAPSAELYRRAAVELGYDKGPQRLNAKGILHDFCEFYGAAFLGKLGIIISSRYRQPIELLNRRLDHPLIHVLMQRFLEQRAEETNTELQLTRKQIGPIRCPNPYAAHPADFRIENVARKKSPDGSAYLVANCTCGYGFTFRRTDDRDPAIPIVQSRVRFGETFEREARRLYCNTASVPFVAKMMDVSIHLARRLIRGQKSKREDRRDPDPIRIAKLRVEWKASKSAAATIALWRNDRAWLLEQKKEEKAAPRKAASGNLEEDAAIANEIRAAAAVLLSTMPPRRITNHAVCRQLGRTKTLLNKLPRLPLSRAEMSKVTESLAEWNARRNATGIDAPFPGD